MFHIPKQYFRRPGLQRFIVGFILGAIIGWVFFFAFHGIAQERQIEIINKQRSRIESLKKDKDTLQEHAKEENKKRQKKLTVQDIQMTFTDQNKSDMSETERSKLKENIRDQLSSILTQNIETVSANRELIYLIENKRYEIDDDTYKVKIQTLVIYSTVDIVLKATEET